MAAAALSILSFTLFDIRARSIIPNEKNVFQINEAWEAAKMVFCANDVTLKAEEGNGNVGRGIAAFMTIDGDDTTDTPVDGKEVVFATMFLVMHGLTLLQLV